MTEEARFLGTQDGPPERLLPRPRGEPRWGVSRRTIIGVAEALDDVERHQASQEPLLAPGGLVQLVKDDGIEQDDELAKRLTPEEQWRRLPLIDGRP